MKSRLSKRALKHLLSISQAANFLGVSTFTLRNWKEQGKIIPHRGEGGIRRYRLSQLKRLKELYCSKPLVLKRLKSLSVITVPDTQKSEVIIDREWQAFQNTQNLTPSVLVSEVEEEATVKNVPKIYASALTHIIFTALCLILISSTLLTGLITASYIFSPLRTKTFFASNPFFSPFNSLSLKILPALSPQISSSVLVQTPGVEKFLTPGVNESASNVLAEEAAAGYLEVNADTYIKGDLIVQNNVNGLDLTSTLPGISIKDSQSDTSLTVVAGNNIILDQSLNTASSPTFSALNILGTSKQLILGSGITGTLTWTPTGTSKTITIPNITDTLVTKTSTDTLSNKTIKSSDSNTISGSFPDITGITSLGTVSTGTWNGTKIGTTYGGTGLTSYTLGDVIYASAANTLAQLNIGTTGQVLTVVSGIPAWANASGGVTSVNSLTGGLTISGGGINAISAADTTITITGTEADTLATVTGRGATTSTAVTFSSTINSNTFTSTALTFAGASPAISASTAGTNINLNAGTTGKVVIAGTSTGDVDLAGGSTDYGCTITNATGTMTCSGDIIGGSTGTSGYWTRAGTSLSPSTAGDSITTSGGISTTGSGTLSIAGAATFTSTINSNTFTSTALTFAGTTPVISASTAATDISVNPGVGGNVLLAGGSASYGCSVNDTTGDLTCTGTIVSSGGGGVGYWQTDGLTPPTLSPETTGGHITTSGNIYTSGTGTITSGGLLTGQTGLTVTGGATSLNASSNYDTNINTGTSTGAISIGNSAAGAITLQSNAASVFHAPANTATAFRFTDGTNAYQTIDTRSTLSGVSAFTFAAGTAPTIASASNAEFTTLTTTPPTITLTGTTQVTSQMDSTLINAPIITDASAVTVDKAATLTIAGAPVSGATGLATLTDSYALKINAASVDSGTGTVTNAYGLYVDAPTGGGSNYAAIFNTGNVGIGTTPSYKLDLATSTVSDRGINIANTAATGTNYGIYSSVTGAATANYGGYFVSTGATTNYGLAVAALTGTTSTGLDIGALSGGTANLGINIGAISGAGTSSSLTTGANTATGATAYQLNLGAISGANATSHTSIALDNISGTTAAAAGISLGTLTGGTTSNYQISTGVLTSATTTTNAQLNLGGVVTTGGITNYGINVGALSGTGTTNYGVNVAALTSTGTTNYGLYLGGDTGAATTNYGLYLGTVSGATTNYGALLAGTWFTGGTATTTKPQLLVEPSGTTSTGWSTSGTGLGINSAQTFAGNLLDLQQAGLSTFKVAGVSTAVNGFTFTTAATGAPSTVSMAASGSDTNITLGIDSKGTGALNLGTGANAKTITIGNNTTSTALALTSGTGSQTFTSSVVSGTTTTSGFVFTDNTTLTGTEAYIGSTGVTSGTLLNIDTGAANTLSSGKLLSLTTTSTGLTSGSLASFDWSPTGSTNIYATGDLVSISTGNAYAFVGNLLNIKSQGSSVFSVSDTAVTSGLPTNFTAAGDVAVSYDLNFTNPTASFIKSAAPIYIQAGETFNSSDLTLQTYNQGSIVLDSAITTGTGVNFNNSTLTTGTGVNIASTTLTSGTLLNVAPTFAGSAVTGYGEYINGADSTANANTDYQLYSNLALTGNAAKTGVGLYSTLSTSSTTADTVIAADLATSTTGVITTGTRSAYGLRTQPASTAASTGGTTNVYGVYTKPGGVVGAGGTINSYGVYVANGTMDGTGTSANYGLALEPLSGASTNIGICFDCDGTWTASTVASGIQFGTDANAVNLYRNGSDLLQTDDAFTATGAITTSGDLAVNGSTSADITTTTTTASVFNATATTLNIGGAATTVSLGAATGTTTVNNALSLAGNLTAANTVQLSSLTLADGTGACVANVNDTTHAVFVEGAYVPLTSDIFYNSTQGKHARISVSTTCVEGGTTYRVLTLSDTITSQVATDAAKVYTPVSSIGNTTAGFINNLYAINGNFVTSTATGGFDIAEQYPTSDSSLESGEVVAIASGNTSEEKTPGVYEALTPGVNNLEGGVERSSSSYQKSILGVISTKPGITLGDETDDEEAGIYWKKVALAGRVPLKVSTESGTIKAGDFLTSSSIPGVAMKALRPGQVIGKALEDFPANTQDQTPGVEKFLTPGVNTKVSQGKILAFINPSFADPLDLLSNLTLDQNGNLVSSSSLAQANTSGVSPDSPEVNHLEGVNSAGPSLLDLLSAQVARLDSTQTLTEARLASLSARVSQLEKKTPGVSSSTPGVNNLNLTPPDSLLASDSAHLEGEIFKHLPGEFSEATISGTLTSYEGIFQNTLKSLGDTYLGNTIIAGNFSVDGTLSLTGDSLSTLGTLYLQNGPLAGNIDLFNGLVIIDTKGKVTAQTVTTKKLEIDNSDILSASLGSAKISAYNLAVTISTTAITQNSKIFLTPTSPTGGQSLIVSKKNPGAGFVVSLDKAYSKDITFDWFIVGGTN